MWQACAWPALVAAAATAADPTSTATASSPGVPVPCTAAARWRRPRDGRRVDILLTHAPPRGVGDGDDPVHQGFTALNESRRAAAACAVAARPRVPVRRRQSGPAAWAHGGAQRLPAASARHRARRGSPCLAVGAPRCGLTRVSRARTSRTTSCVPAGARYLPGSPTGCAVSRTTSTSSCRSTKWSPPSAGRASGPSACRPSGWTRSSAPSIPGATSTAASGPRRAGSASAGSGLPWRSGAARPSRPLTCTASVTCISSRTATTGCR